VSILGNVGSLYMLILILLLIVGLGFLGMGFFNYITGSKQKGTKANINSQIQNGGFLMQNNGWLRLALFSLVGIIIAAAILSFINPGNNMTGHGNMQMQPGMTMQGNMGGMQMTGGMSGMGTMNMSTPMGTDTNTMIIQRLNQMQMQINQMQQMMMYNMGGMQMQSMPQGGMGMMGMPMGNMGGRGMGMMNMMPMGGMSGGSGGMSGGSGSSGGGMGMM